MSLIRVKWFDVRETNDTDRYGKIKIQKGTIRDNGSVSVVYRKRRKRNKTRFMYWSDVGRVRSECFDDVLCEIVPDYSIRER